MTSRSHIHSSGCLLAVVLLTCACTIAQNREQGGDRSILAIGKLQGDNQLQVRSNAFSDAQEIPKLYADYGEGISPQLSWSKPPQGTQSIVVLVEDPDAEEPRPFVHWILFNLPADRTELRQAIPTHPRLKQWGDALQGQNSRGSFGYFGPRPLKDSGTHHYHFQIFALDRELDLLPGAQREEVLEAMQGHVLASGELVGTYEKND
jgi:Raf kinase inhibitor-like YbhB/YbcL family protein